MSSQQINGCALPNAASDLRDYQYFTGMKLVVPRNGITWGQNECDGVPCLELLKNQPVFSHNANLDARNVVRGGHVCPDIHMDRGGEQTVEPSHPRRPLFALPHNSVHRRRRGV